MKNKLLAVLLCLSLILTFSATAFADSAGVTYTAAQVESLCDGILAFKERQSGSSSAQGFIDGYLTDNAGSMSEFYVIALSQYGGYRFDRYKNALLGYIDTHNVYSASTREKYALALIASGSNDSYITDTADEAIGGLGLMSLVFGLHILNNGYDSSKYSVDGLISEILSYQLSDGGWAVMGSRGDVDVTAMTLQALAPYYGRRYAVTSAVDSALSMLSGAQLGSGGFKSMGAENCESSAQVLTALSALGIDAQYDGRFIKNGNSVMTAMSEYRNSDGSFSHIGGGYNESATVQAFYSFVSYLRLCRGQGPLYVLDNANHTPPPAKSDHNTDNSGASGGYVGGNSTSGNQSGNNNSGGGIQRQDNGSAGDDSSASTDKATEKPTETSANSEKPSETVGESLAYGGFQPSATADTLNATADESGGRGGYKVYAISGIIAAAGIACLVLFLLKKRNKKNYIAVAVLAAAGIIFILLTNFESADSYSKTEEKDGFTVSMSIRCDTVTGLEKVNDHIPDDGVILGETEFSAAQGDTAYDILLTASKKYGVPIDNRGAQGSAYIAGINYLYEFDYGDLSGWMYRVNGEFPEVGCQSFTLSDGDKIEWLYTTNIGKDLE